MARQGSGNGSRICDSAHKCPKGSRRLSDLAITDQSDHFDCALRCKMLLGLILATYKEYEHWFYFNDDHSSEQKKGPRSIDLRNLGLVTAVDPMPADCEPSFAFAITSLLENCILCDHFEIREDEVLSTSTAETLDLYETWVYQQGFEFDALDGYCSDFDPISYMNYFTTRTVSEYVVLEGTQSNTDYYDDTATYDDGKIHYQPHEYFEYTENSTFWTPWLRLTWDSPKNNIPRMQSYLSRGIAVLTSIETSANQYEFDKYTSRDYSGNPTYLIAQCLVSVPSNLNVVLVGYGEINKTKVWIAKNPQSKTWGEDGFFYIRMGFNDYCIERAAYVMIPWYFEKDAGVIRTQVTTPFETYHTVDSDNGKYVDFGLAEKSTKLVKTIVIVAVTLLIVLIFISLVFLCVKRFKKIAAAANTTIESAPQIVQENDEAQQPVEQSNYEAEDYQQDNYIQPASQQIMYQAPVQQVPAQEVNYEYNYNYDNTNTFIPLI